MEYQYQVTVEQQKTLFLFAYFNRPYLSLYRRFSGPFLLVASLYFFYSGTGRDSVIVSLLLFCYAMYMLVHPHLLVRRINFRPADLTISIDNELVTMSGDEGTVSVHRGHIQQVFIKKNHLFLKIGSGRSRYLIFDLSLFAEKSDSFVSDVIHLAGRGRDE